MNTETHNAVPCSTKNRTRLTVFSMAAAAMLTLGGSLVAGGSAEAASVCVTFPNGVQLCVNAEGENSLGGGSGAASTPSEEYIQTIGITTHIGSGENLVQTYKPNVTRPDITRVCLNNQKGGQRSLAHDFGRSINTLSAQPGGQSCANFPSNARVTFTPYTNRDPATPAKTLVYSLSAYAGGILRLTWQ
jgi:hypothetical protein